MDFKSVPVKAYISRISAPALLAALVFHAPEASAQVTITNNSGAGSYQFNNGSTNNYVICRNQCDFNGTLFKYDMYFGGDSSPHDTLTIGDAQGVYTAGSFTGNVVLDYYAAGGGTGAQTVNGIQAVAVLDTIAADTATVRLLNGPIDVGVWEYDLFKGSADGADPRSWYLRSSNRLTSSAGTLMQIPALGMGFVKTGMASLRKRLGELRDSAAADSNAAAGAKKNYGLWIRSHAHNMEVSDVLTSRMNLYGLEAGADAPVYASRGNTVYAGVMGGYLYAENIKTVQNNGSVGRGRANIPNAGAYVTWLNRGGWFADATFRGFWQDIAASSYAAGNLRTDYAVDRDFSAFTLEAGRRITFPGAKAGEKFVLEPKAEFSGIYSPSKDFRTSRGDGVETGRMLGTVGRLAVLGGYDIVEDGVLLHPFVEVGVSEEFSGKTAIRYMGDRLRSDLGGAALELSAGLNAKLDEEWSLYSDITFEKGGKIEAYSANFGFRYNF